MFDLIRGCLHFDIKFNVEFNTLKYADIDQKVKAPLIDLGFEEISYKLSAPATIERIIVPEAKKQGFNLTYHIKNFDDNVYMIPLSYYVEGDLARMVLLETMTPWNTPKYYKRLERFFVYYFMACYNYIDNCKLSALDSAMESMRKLLPTSIDPRVIIASFKNILLALESVKNVGSMEAGVYELFHNVYGHNIPELGMSNGSASLQNIPIVLQECIYFTSLFVEQYTNAKQFATECNKFKINSTVI